MVGMRNPGKYFAIALLSVTPLVSAETKVKLEDLPPAVKNAVAEQTKGATLIGITKEKEKGKLVYEVETKVDNRTRDLIFNEKGTVLTVEQEIDLATVPAAAKDAIQKKAGGAEIKKVESVTEGSAVTYEATISRKGKTSEFSVNADGSPKK
jgi:uncharacterized membrane protein YkoI